MERRGRRERHEYGNLEDRDGRERCGDRDGHGGREGQDGREGRDGRGRHDDRDERGGREGQDGREGRDGHGRHEGRDGRGRHDDRDGQGKHGGGRPERKGYRVLAEKPGTHLLFIGSRSCTRHKGTVKLELQQEGKLTFLSLDEIDWITGGYLQQIEDAAREIAEEIHPQHLVLFGGCQIELLSTDYEALTQKLSQELGIEVRFHKGCHLVGYDPDADE